ncbi:MAG: hypothetical protein WB870_03725 [Gallionellaceae bacterium]
MIESTYDEKAAISLARNKETSADALKALVGHSDKVDRLVAKHPNTSVDVLDMLSKSKDKITRRNVFKNPNTSLTAVLMVDEFPEEIISLPVRTLNDLIIEHSETILGIRQPLFFQMLSNQKCPNVLLKWASERGGYYEQLAVWKNPITSVDLLSRMMAYGYQQEGNVLLALPVNIHEFLTDLGYVGSPPGSYEELCNCRWLSQKSAETGSLWNKLVPKLGKAETIQGEMVRAIGRIQGDYYKNGWGNWHQQYDLSQFLATHLVDDNTFSPYTVSVLLSDIRAMDLCGQRCMYEGNLEQTFLDSINDMEEIFQRLDAAIVVWCDRHPEPIPYQ